MLRKYTKKVVPKTHKINSKTINELIDNIDTKNASEKLLFLSGYDLAINHCQKMMHKFRLSFIRSDNHDLLFNLDMELARLRKLEKITIKELTTVDTLMQSLREKKRKKRNEGKARTGYQNHRYLSKKTSKM